MTGSFATPPERAAVPVGAARVTSRQMLWPLAGIVAGPLALAALGTTHPRRARVPGAALLLLGALPFTRSHIYFPVGVGALLLLAAGCGSLQWVRLHPVLRG